MITTNYQNKQDQFLQKSCKVYNQSIPSQRQNYLKINKEKKMKIQWGMEEGGMNMTMECYDPRPPLNQNSYLACTFSWKFQSLNFSKPAGMIITEL